MTAPAAGTLAKALVAFQKNAPKIALDARNPHFNSKFASLAGIMESVRPGLADNGLAIVQQPTTLDSGLPGLRTTLLHVSGDSLSEVMPLAVDKPGPQALGSAITYARRYSVLAILGLVGDEDDDGNSAQQASEKKAAANGNSDGAPDMLAELAEKMVTARRATWQQIASACGTFLEPTAGKDDVLPILGALAKKDADELAGRFQTSLKNAGAAA